MRRRRNNRNNHESEAAVIDLTPVLDMTFIMLIFFIVTSTFVNEAGIKVQRPPPRPGSFRARGRS